MTTTIEANLASPQSKADPFPLYARLRKESPVAKVRQPDGATFWIVSRYNDALELLKDERFAKDALNAKTAAGRTNRPWMPAIFRPLSRNMLDLDPPDHTRLRGLVHKAFTPRMVDSLRSRSESLANELLDRTGVRGHLDLVKEFALPVPVAIIAETLGVPAADREKFHRWSAGVVALNPSGGAGTLLAMPSLIFFLRYIRKLIRMRRSQPSEDLISALIAAEEAGDKLNENELVAMIFLLLIAGHETTVNLLSNGVLALLDHPSEMDRLRRRPDLITRAVEEMVRFAGPSGVFDRAFRTY